MCVPVMPDCIMCSGERVLLSTMSGPCSFGSSRGSEDEGALQKR